MHGLHGRDANPLKIAATRGYGAEVDLDAESPRGARPAARVRRKRAGRSCIRSTIRAPGRARDVGLEVVEDIPDVATMVVPDRRRRPHRGVASAVDCRVVGVEPERAPSLTAALEAASRFASSRAPCRGRPQCPVHGRDTLDVCRERVDEIVLVTEDEIEEGMRFLYTRAKLACEPAGAAAVAALLAGKVGCEAGPMVAVVSGGNADPKVAAAILARR